MAIDSQHHAIALQHGDDPLIAGKAGEATRLGNIGNRQAPAEAFEASAGIASDFFGAATAIFPGHARVIGRAQNFQRAHLLKRPSKR
ncbi:hypothetical protein D3C81_1704060 [compost metagenome]